ncbi:MAG: HRDC domain-containing protein, partial [Bdellovibrio bacteriovorus]
RRFGHDRISTFGIGKELSAEQWKSVYRQLVAAGLAAVDLEGHGSLKLTQQSRPVLRGERRLWLRRDPERRRAAGRPRTAAGEPPLDSESGLLWERLRAHRRELAQDQGVPPYVIFGDATLREMVTYRPRNRAELACISGVGVVKLERYGDGFLGVLAGHSVEHGRPADCPPLSEAPLYVGPRPQGPASDAGLTSTVRETLELLLSGVPVDQIAERRGLRTTTVYSHLARCIEEGELPLGKVVALSEGEISAIQFAFEQLPPDSPMTLKPVYDAFQGQYDYGVLRCVRAAMAGD